MKTVTKNELNEVLALASRRKAEILNSKSCYPTSGTVYYFDAENGRDDNDGLSPETAKQTLPAVQFTGAKPGDTILFKRGQVFRGCMRPGAKGITFSSYGEGKKPLFCNSIDASSPNCWVKTDAENVWMCNIMIPFVKDVGAIIFNGGECWGIKICENTITGERSDMYRSNGRRGEGVPHGELDVWNGRRFVHRECAPFTGYKDIKGDLEFFHKYNGFEHVFLNCADGNPGEVFDTIEFTLRHAAVQGNCTDCVFDNLSFKYANFGMGIGGSNNLIIRNCEFGWIGGSSQFPESYAAKSPNTPYGSDVTRLGNGIEIWGDCNGFTIENCFFEQVYDAAVTVQISRNPADRDYSMQNIRWINNVFDTCHYCFELWLSIGDRNGFKQELKNVDISGNICLNSGFGWAHQRPDPCYTFYYGSNEWAGKADFENCSIHDNIFINGRGTIVAANGIGANKMQFDNNKVYHNRSFGSVRTSCDEANPEIKGFRMTEEDTNALNNGDFLGKNEFYRLAEECIPEGNIIKF